MERPYRNQNPFDGRNKVQPAKTFTPPTELVGVCKPGMDPHTQFMLEARKMVQDMYVQVDGTWMKLFNTPQVGTQTGLTFDPYYFFYATNDQQYLCTWVKPKEPPSFPGVLEMIAAEREARTDPPVYVPEAEQETNPDESERYGIMETRSTER